MEISGTGNILLHAEGEDIAGVIFFQEGTDTLSQMGIEIHTQVDEKHVEGKEDNREDDSWFPVG